MNRHLVLAVLMMLALVVVGWLYANARNDRCPAPDCALHVIDGEIHFVGMTEECLTQVFDWCGKSITIEGKHPGDL